jgi:putative transposase
MLWREIYPTEEKTRFIAVVLAAEESTAVSCAEFGISRKTGYKWLTRYHARGPGGLYELSRAPQRVPSAISDAQVAAIVEVRRAHPSLGAKEAAGQAQRTRAVRTLARAEHDWGITAPAWVDASTQTAPPRGAHPRDALKVAVAANDLWCIDFKWRFRTGDRARCDPLTVSDAFSRYLLCAQALTHPDYDGCRARLERVFREYGLPRAIRSDNGALRLARRGRP